MKSRRPADTEAHVQSLRITGLTYGAHGVGRVGGKVLFVRGVLPGEEVDVRVREQRRSFAYADVERIRQASPERREPPCPYLPRCGGCPWQHMQYAAQLQAKEENVREQLRRIGGLPDVPVLPIRPSPREFHYRSRLALRVENKRLGFYAAGTHELVPVDHCLLGEETVDAAIPPTSTLLQRLTSHVRRVEIAARGIGNQVMLRGEVQGAFEDRDDAVISAWLKEHRQITGLVMHGRRWRRTWGETSVRFSPREGLEVQVQGGVFTQVNPEGNRELVRTVMELGEFRRSDRVLDLYAGAGNFSLAVAPHVAEVVAVEQDRLAAADAAREAARLGFDNLRVQHASAVQALARIVDEGASFDTVLLDPPRGGAAECVDALLRLSAPRLVYISCNPATLGRDLKGLSRRYRFDVVQPIDLFPQTYHVECVVRAVLTC